MRYLGLDISSNSTGWAVLEEDTVIGHGVIKTKGDSLTKLTDFYVQFVNLLEEYPDICWVGIEDIYIDNAKTAKVLGWYHGVALLVLQPRYNLTEILRGKDLKDLEEKLKNPRARPSVPKHAIFMPMPTEIFSYIGVPYPRDRDKKKQEVLSWVEDNLYISLSRAQDDEADAIAIAFATKQARNRMKTYEDNRIRT